MNAMAPPRPTELHRCRVRLATGPAAASEARSQVRAAICAWDVPVDPDVAVLLTSELVTNAIKYEASGTVTLAITCSCRQLRVDVFDTCCLLPVVVDAAADAETGRGLMLVATLSADWGFYPIPTGKAVYFTLEFAPDLAEGGGRDLAEGGGGDLPQGEGRVAAGGSYVGAVSRNPPGGSPSPLNAPALCWPAGTTPQNPPRGAARSPRRDGAQGRLTGNIGPRVDIELLQDVGDVSRDGSPG
jgi:anti-sigma regulatory factor (Ser/Thr protein kinase)